jgi:predicted nucleic acid-binding Zn finger protein
MGRARLTVALTSWSESKWASAASFDALMPREGDAQVVERTVAVLGERGPLPIAEIATQTKQSVHDARNALQRACLQGRVLFDLDRQVYRPRALLAEPVDESAIRFGSAREAQAHRLLEGKVSVEKVHHMAGEGVEISGEIDDKAMHRSFSPRFFLDVEGQVTDAWCNCPTYMRSALREGPCEHMIALRVKYQRDQVEAEHLRTTPEGRKLVRAETRTLLRRDASGAQTSYRVSLDDRVVRIARVVGSDARHQRLWFDTDAQARRARRRGLHRHRRNSLINETNERKEDDGRSYEMLSEVATHQPLRLERRGGVAPSRRIADHPSQGSLFLALSPIIITGEASS